MAKTITKDNQTAEPYIPRSRAEKDAYRVEVQTGLRNWVNLHHHHLVPTEDPEVFLADEAMAETIEIIGFREVLALADLAETVHG